MDKQLKLITTYLIPGIKTDIEVVYAKIIQKYLLFNQIKDKVLYVINIRFSSKKS